MSSLTNACQSGPAGPERRDLSAIDLRAENLSLILAEWFCLWGRRTAAQENLPAIEKAKELSGAYELISAAIDGIEVKLPCIATCVRLSEAAFDFVHSFLRIEAQATTEEESALPKANGYDDFLAQDVDFSAMYLFGLKPVEWALLPLLSGGGEVPRLRANPVVIRMARTWFAHFGYKPEGLCPQEVISFTDAVYIAYGKESALIFARLISDHLMKNRTNIQNFYKLV